MLENYSLLFNSTAKRIVNVYIFLQEEFAKSRIDDIVYIRWIDKTLENDSFFSPNIPTLLVLDDKSNDEIRDNKKQPHWLHKMCIIKFTNLFLYQNRSKQGKAMHDITLNCQYIVLLKSVPDTHQVKYFRRQFGHSHLKGASKKQIRYLTDILHRHALKNIRCITSSVAYFFDSKHLRQKNL